MSIDTVEGRLIKYGPANYLFDREQRRSYYAMILTSAGPLTLWGLGLEQAIAQSKTQVKVGDRVTARRVDKNRQTGRVQWQIETPEWIAARAMRARIARDDLLEIKRVARENPELARAMKLRAADLIAERRLSNSAQRRAFTTAVSSRLQEREREQNTTAPAASVERNTTGAPNMNSRAR